MDEVIADGLIDGGAFGGGKGGDRMVNDDERGDCGGNKYCESLCAYRLGFFIDDISKGLYGTE